LRLHSKNVPPKRRVRYYICEVERRQASISILHNIVFTIALRCILLFSPRTNSLNHRKRLRGTSARERSSGTVTPNASSASNKKTTFFDSDATKTTEGSRMLRSIIRRVLNGHWRLLPMGRISLPVQSQIWHMT